MKKLLILFIFLIVCTAQAQTNEKEALTQLNKTVVSLYQNKKFDEALKNALQAVDLSVKIYGSERAETAAAYTNLGVIYSEKKKLGESIENFQKAADVYGKSPGYKGEQSVAIYITLAYTQLLDGRKKEAESSYLKAIETAENVFGKESKESYLPKLSLANFYASYGKLESADDFYLKSYAAAVKNFDKESKEIEQIGNSRSCIFYGRKEGDEKEKAFDAAVDKLFGKDGSEKLGMVNGKALLLPKPRYPVEAHEKRLAGVASVRVKISVQGNVIEAKSICREDILGRTAEESARGAKFQPTTKDGKPVEVTGIIVYNFIP